MSPSPVSENSSLYPREGNDGRAGSRLLRSRVESHRGGGRRDNPTGNLADRGSLLSGVRLCIPPGDFPSGDSNRSPWVVSIRSNYRAFSLTGSASEYQALGMAEA